MDKREVVRTALEFRRPPYVPWSFGFTVEAWAKLAERFGADRVEDRLDDHLVTVDADGSIWEALPNDRYRDH